MKTRLINMDASRVAHIAGICLQGDLNVDSSTQWTGDFDFRIVNVVRERGTIQPQHPWLV